MTEETTTEQAQLSANEELRVRYLNASFTSPKELATVDTPEGVIVPDFPLLATGVWTDSAVRTPLNYPKATLEAYASNWADRGVWTRHPGATPRSITDKIGEVRRERYESSVAGGAVVGDVLFYNDTQASKDALRMVKSGRINAISVEHGWSEKFNSATGNMDATSLVFYGAALVDKGACKTCVLKKNESPGALPQNEADGMTENTEPSKALEAKITELEKALGEAPKVEDIKNLSDKLEASTKELADLKQTSEKALADMKAVHDKELADLKAGYEERIKALENEPQTPKTLAQPEAKVVSLPDYKGPRLVREGKDIIIE